MTLRERVRKIEQWFRDRLPLTWYYNLPHWAQSLISGIVAHGGETFVWVGFWVLIAGRVNGWLGLAAGTLAYVAAIWFWLWHEEYLEEPTFDSVMDVFGPIVIGAIPLIMAIPR